jgi:hypothetical protein
VLANAADARVKGIPRRVSASAAPGSFRHSQAEDDLLAFLLIHTWTLTTGRVLRSDVPPAQLSEEELIDFWADDHIPHATGNGVRAVSQA